MILLRRQDLKGRVPNVQRDCEEDCGDDDCDEQWDEQVVAAYPPQDHFNRQRSDAFFCTPVSQTLLMRPFFEGCCC